MPLITTPAWLTCR